MVMSSAWILVGIPTRIKPSIKASAGDTAVHLGIILHVPQYSTPRDSRGPQDNLGTTYQMRIIISDIIRSLGRLFGMRDAPVASARRPTPTRTLPSLPLS